MSVKNKTLDRNARGMIVKYDSLGPAQPVKPNWYMKLNLNRCRRHVDKRLCRDIQNGSESEAMPFGLSNKHKPIHYHENNYPCHTLDQV